MPPLNLADDIKQAANDAPASSSKVLGMWPDPQTIKSGLLDVEPFRMALLPVPFRAWVQDIAEKMQVPADFVAVPVMIAAGSVLGNKIAVRPQRNTDWTVYANLFGCIVGKPGVMKSPAMGQAHGPLYRLALQARADFESLKKDYDAAAMERTIKTDVAKLEMRKLLKANGSADVSGILPEDEQEPTMRRYVVNDITYQAAAELMRQNPNGLLAIKDELASLLTSLRGEDASEARGFYLTGWDGGESYTVDRIGRGFNMTIDKLTLSLVGSTQPSKIRQFIASAVGGDHHDDGLIQRFGMMVWPDITSDWVEHDVPMDKEARDKAYSTFDYLNALTPPMAGASIDEFHDGLAYLRFDDGGLEEFQQWRTDLELRIRADDWHPALESHFSKYRKLVPALALIYHLASGNTGSISLASVKAALGWAQYLESHAHRIYGAAFDQSSIAAKSLFQKIKAGKLLDGFKPADVQRKGWAGLGDKKAVRDALEIMEEHDLLRIIETPSGPDGGRPSVIVRINSKVMQ